MNPHDRIAANCKAADIILPAVNRFYFFNYKISIHLFDY